MDLFAGLAAAAGLTPAAWFTRALTAVVVAGGSNLLHDLWPRGRFQDGRRVFLFLLSPAAVFRA